MDVFGLLQTTAQLALGFAGFGSIASGLRQKQKSDDTRVDAGRLINMLTLSLSAMTIALTPCFVNLFDLSEQWLWRLSAFIAGATMAGLAPGVLARSRRMRKFAGYDGPTALLNNILASSGFVAFVLCALGAPRTHLPGVYVAGVFALLLMSALLFFRVTLSVLRPHAPD